MNASVVVAACVVVVIVVVAVEFDVTSSNSVDIVVDVVAVVIVIIVVAVIVVTAVISGMIENELNASIQLIKSIIRWDVSAGESDGLVTMLGVEVGLIPVSAVAIATVPFCDGMACVLVDDDCNDTIILSVGSAMEAPFDWKGTSSSIGNGLRWMEYHAPAPEEDASTSSTTVGCYLSKRLWTSMVGNGCPLMLESGKCEYCLQRS